MIIKTTDKMTLLMVIKIFINEYSAPYFIVKAFYEVCYDMRYELPPLLSFRIWQQMMFTQILVNTLLPSWQKWQEDNIDKLSETYAREEGMDEE